MLSAFGSEIPSPNTENTAFACGGYLDIVAGPGCTAGCELVTEGAWRRAVTSEVAFTLMKRKRFDKRMKTGNNILQLV